MYSHLSRHQMYGMCSCVLLHPVHVPPLRPKIFLYSEGRNDALLRSAHKRNLVYCHLHTTKKIVFFKKGVELSDLIAQHDRCKIWSALPRRHSWKKSRTSASIIIVNNMCITDRLNLGLSFRNRLSLAQFACPTATTARYNENDVTRSIYNGNHATIV